MVLSDAAHEHDFVQDGHVLEDKHVVDVHLGVEVE